MKNKKEKRIFKIVIFAVLFFAGCNFSLAVDCGTGSFESVSGVCLPTDTGLSTATVSTIISNVATWLLVLFTSFAIIAFVISGIQYLTSAGSEDQLDTAKRNAKYALVGVIVGLSGFVIIQAISKALGGTLTSF